MRNVPIMIMAPTCICAAVLFVLTCAFCTANCSPSKNELDQWVERHVREVNFEEQRNIKIIVTGETGTGKSTLINGLIGMEVFKTGKGVKSVTNKVESKSVEKNGIHVNITDTPGLNDKGKKDDDTLKEIRKCSKDIDLFLFCLKMTERIKGSHIDEINAITRVFGKRIWRKVLFVLTFANKIDEEDFNSQLEEWEDELKETIRDNVDAEIAQKITIVPTGFKEPQLHGRRSWLSELWIQGFRKMGFKAMLHFIVLSEERMHNTITRLKLSQEMYANPENQPLVVCYMSKEERWIDPKYIPIIGEIVGGVLFATATALLPGVNIGIPQALTTGSIIGYWAGNLVLENFDWSLKEELHCYDEVIKYSLIVAFLEEYPEYRKLIT